MDHRQIDSPSVEVGSSTPRPPQFINDRFIRLPELLRLTGLGRSSVYRLVERGQLPPPMKISERAVAWRLSSINEWQAAREQLAHELREARNASSP